MKTFFLLAAHGAILVLACSFYCKNYSFLSIFKTIVSTKLLHFLHSSLFSHVILFLGNLLINFSLGKLSSSEFSTYNEKAYEAISDILVLVNMFTNELSLYSMIVFSILYSFKSFSWTLSIKSQKSQTYRIVIACLLAQIATLCALKYCLSLQNVTAKLLILEYFLVLLDLIKAQCIMFLDIRNVEAHRTLCIFIISIVYLFLKSFAFSCFIMQFSIHGRFPYGIVKTLTATVLGLNKKVRLFKKYIKLLADLGSIKETSITDTCAICTDEITSGKRLLCSHVFHATCLKMWCEREISCPVCRAELVFKKEIIYETENEIISGSPIEIEDN
ncbi:hypothetical protein GINT2_001817 [Glugoides intestinalis]